MDRAEVTRTLPKCHLISVLSNKVAERTDTEFDFFGKLNSFRQRVCQEIRQINELFPEYTPHDEQYHLKHLFHVADTVLGRDLIEEMNSTELFLLAISLYGHDWGMAVSNVEKEYILWGELSDGVEEIDLWILRDEHEHILRFAKDEGLQVDPNGHIKGISDDLWCEYVRQTHAARSGERVRQFFLPIDGGVADAASRICVGHWLDFEDLQNYNLYPPDFSVLSESTNIRALSVYLRLVDLLDLAEDRTPYVIWKFVAPRDPRSKMEWAKHRALRPVTCPEYQEGRIIRVDGSTDDHEVYAALEDMRIWCENQLRGCNDILARMSDPRHKLDLYHIDWRVAARGFQPVLVQFEFDRDRMFDILGDEIYQSDPYVFLRELLQNSIDAIRMRREVLKNNGIETRKVGVIQVDVQHGENCDAVVNWTDDGIGMDEYIVRNYLAVAGKSYYRSKDFEREGLKMDPISRFGIGILSCFMVADRIEIDTLREPYMHSQSQRLKITIPAMHRQFRIEVHPHMGAKVGTTFRVYVEGKKIPVEDEQKAPEPLKVTDYLCEVAGFVEFPIVITEGDRKTIIIHPDQDSDLAKQRFGEDSAIHTVDFSYPWSEVFLPQDVQTARQLLCEKQYRLSTDLGMRDYDGFITYIVPQNNEADIRNFSVYEDLETTGAEIMIPGQSDYVKGRFRWSDRWNNYFMLDPVPKKATPSRSCAHSPAYIVYRDGILLSTVSAPISPVERTWIWTSCLPVPRIVVNLAKSMAPRIDLARTQMHSRSGPWDAPVWQAFSKHICKTLLNDLLTLDTDERFYHLGRVAVLYRISWSDLWEDISQQDWPLLFLESGGELRVFEWRELSTNTIYPLPEYLRDDLERMIIPKWYWKEEECEGILTHWGGEKVLLTDIGYSSNVGASISDMLRLGRLLLEKSHRVDAIRFLTPPWKDNPPLAQETWIPAEIRNEQTNTEILLEKAVGDFETLDSLERAALIEEIKKHFPRPIKIASFTRPFEKHFAHGWDYLNLEHSLTQELIRLISSILLARIRQTHQEEQLGHIQDIVSTLPFSGHFRSIPLDETNNRLANIWELAEKEKLLDVSKDMVLSVDDFIPGTVIIEEESGQLTEYEIDLRKIIDIAPFGTPIE